MASAYNWVKITYLIKYTCFPNTLQFVNSDKLIEANVIIVTIKLIATMFNSRWETICMKHLASYKNAIVNKFTSVYSMICWIFMQKIATNKLTLFI